MNLYRGHSTGELSFSTEVKCMGDLSAQGSTGELSYILHKGSNVWGGGGDKVRIFTVVYSAGELAYILHKGSNVWGSR